MKPKNEDELFHVIWQTIWHDMNWHVLTRVNVSIFEMYVTLKRRVISRVKGNVRVKKF